MSKIVMRTTFFIVLLTITCQLSGFDGWNSPNESPSEHNIFKDGSVFRISIIESSVYKLTGKWLSEETGLNLEELSAGNFQIYGQPGGPLNHTSNFDETERLVPISMSIHGLEDGSFSADDYILFYAEGADSEYYVEEESRYFLQKNPFSEENYVFLKIGGTIEEKTLILENPSQNDFLTSDAYLYRDFFHEDKVNLLDAFESTQGSGQVWYGDELSNLSSFDLSRHLDIPRSGMVEGQILISCAGRSDSREAVSLKFSEDLATTEFSPVNTGDIEALYARQFQIKLSDLTISPSDAILINFNKMSTTAKLWLDYALVQGWSKMIYDQEILKLNNLGLTQASGIGGLSITTNEDIQIWEITRESDVIEKYLHKTSEGFNISSDASMFREYVVFSERDMKTPLLIELVDTSNLIEQSNVDLIIISTTTTLRAAQRLAGHRESHQGLTSLIVDPQNIYDIYSSGRQDPTAIRNYVRDLYRTYSRFNYLLLMGDASFDYRYINQSHPKSNLVPTFETLNSLDPLLAFPSDDYYALLDDGEDGTLRGDLDISVGRLTVNNLVEAEAVVNKIISYDGSSADFGPWKTQITFLADDEDNNLHINDAERIADELNSSHPIFNQEKIYFDAFQQESTPGGNRYPSATRKLNLTAESGALVINYLGHGGPNGWGQERVLKVDDINSWTNFDRLPLIITATCSFTGFDNPAITSAGEAALLNPTGGALALFTTVRSVFASKNFQLTRSVFRELFQQERGRYLSLGEIMRRSKNSNPNDNTNARKFFLIGDPTIELSIPTLAVRTDKINDIEIVENEITEQLSALDQVELEASIVSSDGAIIESFNGDVEIIVYDKASDVQTIANDSRSFKKTFDVQQNIIYRGKAPVVAGKIRTGFTIPVDINYQIGAGKITYYALSQNTTDAVGFSENLLIGGISKAPVTDDSPPLIASYINNRDFLSGDEVPLRNIAILDISDDFGINLSSTGIGHEITATFDGNSKSTIFLNDFLESSPQNPRAGIVTFPLPHLEEGLHQMTIKAFDVANNVGESTIDFIVTENTERKITEVLTVPNPIISTTTFEIFHDILDRNININMNVVDISGRLIETMSTRSISENGKTSFVWTPTVQFPGTYVCYITLKSSSSEETEATIAKKVILLK